MTFTKQNPLTGKSFTKQYPPGHKRPPTAGKSKPTANPFTKPRPMPVPKKAGSSSDRWTEVKVEPKTEDDDEDDFYDADDGSGTSWLTADCPSLPKALIPLIPAMTNYMEDLVILEEDDSRPETQRWAVYEVTNSFEQVFDGNNYCWDEPNVKHIP